MTSLALPVENGITAVMGLTGYSCAKAGAQKSRTQTAKALT